MEAIYIAQLTSAHLISCVTLASATCVVYDYLSTLEIEIEVVWKRPKWNIVQGLFFINRYLGLALQIYTAVFNIRRVIRTETETQSCQTYTILNGIFGTTVMLSMQGIMIYRVSSMYAHNLRVIFFLVISYIAEIILNVTLYSLAITSGVKIPHIIPDTAPGQDPYHDVEKLFERLCITNLTYPSWMFVMWLPILLFELFVFCLAVSLAIKHYSAFGARHMLSGATRGSSLVFVLFRDSITFPFISLTLCLINLFGYVNLKSTAVHILFHLPVLMTIVLGPRLILNLREAYYAPYNEELEFIEDDQGGNSYPLAFRTNGNNPQSTTMVRMSTTTLDSS